MMFSCMIFFLLQHLSPLMFVLVRRFPFLDYPTLRTCAAARLLLEGQGMLLPLPICLPFIQRLYPADFFA
jgi:hypothetical protein